MKKTFTIIIPARLSSSRLPKKLLKLIGGRTVLEHSYRVAKKSHASRVVIATDDLRLLEVAHEFGAEAMLTSEDHESGTDRLAECAQLLNLSDQEIVVNLQADEPFMPPEMINLCARTLASDEQAPMATLATRIKASADIMNPNVVKVMINRLGHALYFSRAPIPFNRDQTSLISSDYYFHHLGLYAYRAKFLKYYSQLPLSDMEKIEKLEQLRVLDYGEKIAVAIIDEKPPKGIDTFEDLEAARDFFESLDVGSNED